MIRHIVWDWNGTLVDDVAACVATLNVLLRRHGLPPVTVRQYRERFGFPVRSYYERIGFDFSRHDWDEIAIGFHKIYRVASRGCRLRRGARPALARLREKGYVMSILSACETALLEEMVTARGIRGAFDGLYGMDDFYAHSKVDAGRRLLERLGGDADRLLMVGDTVHDADVAGELGCQAVLLCGGHQSRRRLLETGRPVMSTVAHVLRWLDPPAPPAGPA